MKGEWMLDRREIIFFRTSDRLTLIEEGIPPELEWYEQDVRELLVLYRQAIIDALRLKEKLDTYLYPEEELG